jgi:putative aminopeptidase FrvX
MLLIVGLLSKKDVFPVEALADFDAVLAQAGFKKEVRSVVKPGKQFSVTYEGPNTQKSHVEEMLRSTAEKYGITFTIDVEESVKFP